MATVAIVSFDTINNGQLYWEDICQQLGHTVTKFDSDLITASSLSAFDLIIDYFPGSISTIIAFYNDHMHVDGIPFIISNSPGTGQPLNQCSGDGIPSRLGVIASQNRPDSATTGDVTMHPNFRSNLLALGFRGDSEFPVLGTSSTFSCGAAQVAGKSILISELSPNGARETGACMITSGDARIGAGRDGPNAGDNFPVNVAFVGQSPHAGVVNNHANLLSAAVGWALGTYDTPPTTYSTTKTSAVRYTAIDLTSLVSYADSEITWSETTPANTSVTVESSIDGETWLTIASSGDQIGGLSVSDSLVGVFVTIRVTLATSDGVSTPEFEDLGISIEGEGPPLTASPTDYFQGGPLKWTSGNNSGRAMEVKDYDPLTQEITLFLAMPRDIVAGDTLEIAPGCDKTIGICETKFANAINFQGEPHVPGEDAILKNPDARLS